MPELLIELALAQLRHHRGRWALLALGVALVVAVPVVASGLARTVSAESIRRTISQLDLSNRQLLISQEQDSPLRVGTHAQNDAEARKELATVTGKPVLHQMLYRTLRTKGVLFVLGGVDGLAHEVRLTSGRLPASCTPTRCEVVVIGGADRAGLRLAAGSIGVVVVGTAVRTNPLIASGVLDPSPNPLLLGNGTDAVAALDKLSLFSRYYSWVAEIDPDRVVQLGVPAFVARDQAVENTVYAKVGATTYQRPDTQLLAAQQRADVSEQRFGLLGGFAAVLLLGFAVVAAIGLRREARLLQGVLRRRGGSGRQIVVIHVIQAAAVAAAGLVLGAALGGAGTAAVNDHTGLSAAAAARHALDGAWPTALLLALATAVVVGAVLLWPDAQARAVWRTLDLLAVACLAAALLAGSRGTSTATDVAGDPLVVALPVLASIVAALVAARLWAPAARLVERVLPRRAVAGRIGLLGALRRPLRAVATVAFLTAAIAAVVFAGAYRATLLANDADQAAYQVPLDATITARDGGGQPVLEPNAFGGGSRVYPVVRTSVRVTRLAGVVDSVPLLGLDADTLPLLHRFGRTTGSSDDPRTLARDLTIRTPAAPILPAGTRQIAITATGVDPQTLLTLWLRTASGHQLGVVMTGKDGALTGAVPAGTNGPLTAVAFSVDESADYATHHAHAVGEGPADHQLLSGRLTLGAVRADGRPVDWSWTSWGSALGKAVPTAERLSLGYAINGAPVVADPAYAATSALQLPVAVDPTTAVLAKGGTIPLLLDNDATVTGRIVATLPRLPTQPGRFVLADRAAFATLSALSSPGLNALEFWVRGPVPAHLPYAVTTRASVQADLDADPIGRGARELLIIVALLALGVAALALVLLVIGERRDGAGELYAWEADGIRPAVLRRVLAVRAGAVALVAVPVGIAAGLVVAQAGATLVAVGASGTTPTPPLEVTLGSVWTAAILLAGIGAGLAGGGLVALRAMRERFPVPAEADLR